MTELRVLHVEDEPDIREVVEVSLGLDPELVSRSCGSGQEALAIVRDWRPDIILLDVMMPGMDGPTTLARLRGEVLTENIPVVFMTARAQSRELDQFLALGAAGVIPKPFDPMTLAASVRAYMRSPDNELTALRDGFLQRLADDAATLARHRTALESATALPDTLIRIKDMAHSLAGAGGIYGFPEISEAAGILEEAAMAALNAPASIDGVAGALDHLLASLPAESGQRNTQPWVINAQ